MGYTLRIEDYSTNSKTYSHVIKDMAIRLDLMDNVKYKIGEDGEKDTYRFKMPVSDFAKLVYNLKEMSEENSIWDELRDECIWSYCDFMIGGSPRTIDMEEEQKNHYSEWLDIIKRIYSMFLPILLERVWEKKKYVRFVWE